MTYFGFIVMVAVVGATVVSMLSIHHWLGPRRSSPIHNRPFECGNEPIRIVRGRFSVKFFVVAISIQLETGGNLAEILENSAHLIRERFKLQGRIRTLCAEGKLSAIILIAIPFFVGISLSIMNPKYIGVLFTDPIGKMLIAASLFMMFIGVLAMKKIIAIKV